MENARLSSKLEGGVMVATVLCESITQFDVAPLEHDLKALGAQGLWKLAVDLSKVQLVGSAGLGLFITLRKQAAAAKGKLVFFGISQEIMGMLEITRLTPLLTIAKDRKAALAACA